VIGSTRNVNVYAYTQPTDLRKGIDGLFAIARDVLTVDPLSGHLFLFVSRNCKRAKVLLWDGTGLCVFAKRLERGCFAAPWERGTDASIRMTVTELTLFIEGSERVLRTSLSPERFFSSRNAETSRSSCCRRPGLWSL
jgi:transposase